MIQAASIHDCNFVAHWSLRVFMTSTCVFPLQLQRCKAIAECMSKHRAGPVQQTQEASFLNLIFDGLSLRHSKEGVTGLCTSCVGLFHIILRFHVDLRGVCELSTISWSPFSPYISWVLRNRWCPPKWRSWRFFVFFSKVLFFWELGCGFKHFLFAPLGRWSNLLDIFQTSGKKPPTSEVIYCCLQSTVLQFGIWYLLMAVQLTSLIEVVHPSIRRPADVVSPPLASGIVWSSNI